MRTAGNRRIGGPVGLHKVREHEQTVAGAADLFADVARHGYAIFNSDAVDGDEWHDVGCAHAGMRALVEVEVDHFRSLADAADGGFLNGLALADQRDDRTVVVGVTFAIEQIDAGDFHGVDDGVNFGFVAAFGKIWDALYERGHKGEE